MADDGVEVGFEEGKSWLPTHVLDEECDSKQPKSSLKPHHRTRHQTNWSACGSGMQAIFLDSGQRSCGTGVFLPRRAGTDFQPSKKPACSPVLLPSRVVQALNLNVRQLGLQIKPPRDTNNGSRSVDCNAKSNKKAKDASAQRCVISKSPSTSPDIFLPKEWTY